jgi:8-oxo-dGTP pyrophosphatase MutT (NUDIX family)
LSDVRTTVRTAVASIQPFDELEAGHQKDVLQWVDDGEPLFRIAKPDNPPKHLVSYFVLFDESRNSILLIDHLKAKLWLPTGGHVEQDEDPRETVLREAQEELGIDAKFSTVVGDKPLFVTVGKTRGLGTHTDVSLWYVVDGKTDEVFNYDKNEFNSYKWLTLDEVLGYHRDSSVNVT